MAGVVDPPARLEQEPAAFLGFVDEHFQEARSRHVVVVVGKLMGFAHVRDVGLVVGHQFYQHVAGLDEILIVVLDTLKLADMPDRADRCPADLTRTLRQNIDALFNRVRLLVEQEMIAAEMRPTDVPVEVLGFDIERKSIG